jgi:adenine-specific DNA-methyltransferase
MTDHRHNPRPMRNPPPGRKPSPGSGSGHRAPRKAPLRIFPTTLWEYESQHYDSTSGQVGGPGRVSTEQGDRDYVGATPSWIIWQLLQRYTKEKDLVVDPMCGSGTTIDVSRDLGRRALGYDLSPPKERKDIFRADARKLPVEDAKVDFVFIDPPYSTHVDYSDDPRCIGKLDSGGPDRGNAYYDAMERVFAEIHRILKPGRLMGLYVSDSFRKKSGVPRKESREPAAGGIHAHRL